MAVVEAHEDHHHHHLAFERHERRRGDGALYVTHLAFLPNGFGQERAVFCECGHSGFHDLAGFALIVLTRNGLNHVSEADEPCPDSDVERAGGVRAVLVRCGEQVHLARDQGMRGRRRLRNERGQAWRDRVLSEREGHEK